MEFPGIHLRLHVLVFLNWLCRDVLLFRIIYFTSEVPDHVGVHNTVVISELAVSILLVAVRHPEMSVARERGVLTLDHHRDTRNVI